MDRERRRSALRLINQAKNTANQFVSNPAHKEESLINKYKLAVEQLAPIEAKTPEDFYELYDVCWSLAIIYFNKSIFQESVRFYSESIEHLIQTEQGHHEFSDRTLRKLILRYIDLADALTSLCNTPDANLALDRALKAFALIKRKTPDELQLGDPTKSKEHFQKFHNYFEDQTSSPYYLTSSKFKIQQHVMGDHQQSSREEELLVNQFNSSAVLITDKESDSTRTMEGYPTTSTHTLFRPLRVDQTDNDERCRQIIHEYVHQATTMMQANNRTLALASLEQAIAAFKQIKSPNEDDTHLKSRAQDQLNMLKQAAPKATSTPYNASNRQPTTSSQSMHSSYGSGFFSYVPREDLVSSPVSDDMMDITSAAELH